MRSTSLSKRWREWSRSERGVAVAIISGMMVFTVPAVGLAVDATVLYGVRARLSASTDAAALAAARSLSRGLTLSEQQSSAVETANRFFDANFPNGYLRTTGRTVTVNVAETGTRTRTVTVDATVTAPSYFMRFINKTSTSMRAVGRASRRDVNVMMVLDRSGSLAGTPCTAMRSAADAFVKKFANHRDRVGLLTFGGDHRIDFAMQTTPGNFLSGSGSIPDLISRINCTGSTNSAQALWQGYGELRRINEAGSLNVILFFTDGQPNTLTFDFTSANALRTVARGYTGNAPTSASTSQITATSRTPCSTTTNKVGWVQNHSNGRAHGIYNYTATALPAPNSSLISDRSGCVFNMSGGPQLLYGDMGFMPPADIYGNSITGHKTLSTITTTTSPDRNRVRIDHAQTMENAGINAASHAARRIRNNELAATQLDTVIYSIGLGGVGAAEDEFLNRVSNTRESPEFDATKQEGIYVFAPTTAQLNEAFSRIAGEILRIAK